MLTYKKSNYKLRLAELDQDINVTVTTAVTFELQYVMLATTKKFENGQVLSWIINEQLHNSNSLGSPPKIETDSMGCSTTYNDKPQSYIFIHNHIHCTHLSKTFG